MDLEEATAKRLLAEAGVAIPRGELATSPEEAMAAARHLGGPVVIKAQVRTGKRGRGGGILFAATPADAAAAAERLLGSSVGGETVEYVLVDERVRIAREMYAAVVNDSESQSPLLLFSREGGMDIEEITARAPEKLIRQPLDIRRELSVDAVRSLLAGRQAVPGLVHAVADFLVVIYQCYRQMDAELLEVNPLVVDMRGRLVALDAKLTVDDSALPRHPDLASLQKIAMARSGTELERRARRLGLLYIELDGDIAVLANGAGLTMATLDMITLGGGRPANFLEIGGANYTQAVVALRLVLDNVRVSTLLVNFCGAFARTDVMAQGVVEAWEERRPALPVFFSVHGTGEQEAIRLLRERLGIESYDRMEDAVRAAISAATAAATKSSL